MMQKYVAKCGDFKSLAGDVKEMRSLIMLYINTISERLC